MTTERSLPDGAATDEEIAKGKAALPDQSVSLFVLKWADDDPCGLRVVMKHAASATYTINLSRLYARLDHEIARADKAEKELGNMKIAARFYAWLTDRIKEYE